MAGSTGLEPATSGLTERSAVEPAPPGSAVTRSLLKRITSRPSHGALGSSRGKWGVFGRPWAKWRAKWNAFHPPGSFPRCRYRAGPVTSGERPSRSGSAIVAAQGPRPSRVRNRLASTASRYVSNPRRSLDAAEFARVFVPDQREGNPGGAGEREVGGDHHLGSHHA
jgi:hypothetical protein